MSEHDAEILRLRAALSVYADRSRWGFRHMSDVQRLWRGVDDDDRTDGWRLAAETLAACGQVSMR